MTWVCIIDSIQESKMASYKTLLRYSEYVRKIDKRRPVVARISGRTLPEAVQAMASHRCIREYNGSNLSIEIGHKQDQKEHLRRRKHHQQRQQQQQQRPTERNDNKEEATENKQSTRNINSFNNIKDKAFKQSLVDLREMLRTKNNVQKVVVNIENSADTDLSHSAWIVLETLVLGLPGLEDLSLFAKEIPIHTLKSIVQGLKALKKLELSISLRSRNDPDKPSLSSILAHHSALESLRICVYRLEKSGRISMLHGIADIPKLERLELDSYSTILNAEFFSLLKGCKSLKFLTVNGHPENARSLLGLLQDSTSLKFLNFTCSSVDERFGPRFVQRQEQPPMLPLADVLQCTKSLRNVTVRLQHGHFTGEVVKRFTKAVRENHKLSLKLWQGGTFGDVEDESLDYYCKLNQFRGDYDHFATAMGNWYKFYLLEHLATHVPVLFQTMYDSEYGPSPLVSLCENAITKGDGGPAAVKDVPILTTSKRCRADPDSAHGNTINKNDNKLASSYSGKRIGSERTTSLIDPRLTIKRQRL